MHFLRNSSFLAAQKRHVTIGATGRFRSLLGKSQSPQFAAPATGTLHAYDEAVKLLECEQTRLRSEISALELSNNFSAAKEKKVALGLTMLETHWKFNAGVVDFDTLSPSSEAAETFEALKQKRFYSVTVPKLVKLAELHKIYVDAFPGKPENIAKPKVNVEVNFSNTKWEACYGQPVPPNWALYSPKVTINTHSDKEAKYTLILMDLDRQNLSTNSIQEWCHWFITDLTITNRLVIQPGSSPYLSDSKIDTSNLVGASFHPLKPASEPKIPGNVVFPYIPPHPANSNPRNMHRYLLTVFEQTESVKVDLKALKLEALQKLQQQQTDKKDWELDVIGSREDELKFVERGAFSTWGVAKKYGLNVAGYAFFTSGWNLHTPDVFTRLGIHEPVYGKLPENVVDAVHRINQATETVSTTIGDRLLSSLTLSDIKKLNSGIKTPLPKFKIPTKYGLQAEELRAKHASRIVSESKTAAAKAGKGKKGKTVLPPVAVNLSKMPRLTTVGSVAVVRSKGTDVASKRMGALTKSVFEQRGRYHNV